MKIGTVNSRGARGKEIKREESSEGALGKLGGYKESLCCQQKQGKGELFKGKKKYRVSKETSANEGNAYTVGIR